MRRLYHFVVGWMTNTLMFHHRGGTYRYLGDVTNSTNGRENSPMVLYFSIAKGTTHVRDKSEMFDLMRCGYDGKFRPRFCYTHNVNKDWWK